MTPLKISLNSKDLTGVVLKVLGQSIGLSIGVDVYDMLFKKDTDSIDARLAKIETARSNLLEALSAIDEIKTTAEEHQRQLDEVLLSLVQMGQERDQLSAEKELLVQMTAQERDKLRRMLGVPTRLQSVFIWVGTFIFGAVTTWIFTFAYDTGIKAALTAGWKYIFSS